MADKAVVDQQCSGAGGGLSRRGMLGLGVAAGGTLLLPSTTASAAAPVTSVDSRRTQLHRFDAVPKWRRGAANGVAVRGYGLILGKTTTIRSYTDPHVAGASAVSYDEGSWTSPWVANPFAFNELIASWEADTPSGTWVEVTARGRLASGQDTQWFVLGRWCSRDVAQGGAIQRTSLDDQEADYGTVWTDTLHMYTGYTLTHLQLRISLLRKAGSSSTPRVRGLSAVVSSIPSGAPTVTSTPSLNRAVVLNVPTYSQVVHTGHYPQWGSGGQAWCSPTSSTMVLDYWRQGPSAADLAWLGSEKDRQVDFAARNTFDYQYDGCGNWPFNTAYMASFGMSTYVHRLTSLRDAEQYIARGVPVITSLSFKAADLDGAGYGTNGHLMVLVGFDKDGNPVMNDPASHLKPDNAQVRVTYRRDQFERRWLASSGGTVYIAAPRRLTMW